ncbi:MAG: hypothetical protein NT166_28840 [Candidatus Aminicenantes bacterium]|nr:hypothetical protein [Candidatus Aminicenantes bacterium]
MMKKKRKSGREENPGFPSFAASQLPRFLFFRGPVFLRGPSRSSRLFLHFHFLIMKPFGVPLCLRVFVAIFMAGGFSLPMPHRYAIMVPGDSR